MKVLVALPDGNARVYLEGLNGYKNEKCEPKIDDNLAVFQLSLVDFYDCGIIRVVNKLTVSGTSNRSDSVLLLNATNSGQFD